MAANCVKMSTLHLTEETLDAMQGVAYSSMVGIYDRGVFLIVPDSDDTQDEGDRLPHDLVQVIAYARGVGAEYVRLDQDAYILNALPAYPR